MAQLKGIEYLRRKLASKQVRVITRYTFYEMKNKTKDLMISTPPSLRGWMTSLGWCAKAVDSLADRLVFYGFKDDNFGMKEIFDMNNADTLFDSAILGALISSCCFIYISEDESGYPRLQVIDGANATGEMDPITGMLTEGYAVLKRDGGLPVIEAYFTPGQTVIYDKEQKYQIIKNNLAPYPLLVPIIYRPDAIRQFGHSRISRACMSIQGSAIRTVKRAELSGEFYSFPQKYVLGLSPDAEMMDKWKATMSSLLEFDQDENGNYPTVGQFTQQSMQPHTDQLRMFASLFAGETGLTLDDLGFATENPSSAEAIRATHENLRVAGRKAQRTFGTGFLNVGYLAACIRDQYAYQRSQVYMTKPEWDPIFEPDAAMLSGIGDAILKMNQAVPGFLGRSNMRNLTGLDSDNE